MNLDGKNVLVVGLADSGVAASRLLLKHGAKIVGTDKKELLREKFQSYPLNQVELVLGSHPLSLINDKDLIVVSPGVRLDIDLLNEARLKDIPIWGELELAYRFTSSPIIAVSETHGKSTTTSLIFKILTDAGFQAGIGGNIRPPLTEVIEKVPSSGWLVVEVSSFQLETIDKFHPKVAIILNIFEDHLDRHSSMKEFEKIISRVYLNMEPDDLLIGNGRDKRVLSIMEKANTRKAYFAPFDHGKEGVYIKDKLIYYRWNGREEKLISTEEVPLIGEHNLENVMSASVAAIAAGVSSTTIPDSIRSFKGLHHRLEFVRTFKGVSYINDSKATTPHATLVALKAIPEPKVLILGGSDKKVDFSPLTREIPNLNVKWIILIGETRWQIERSLMYSGFSNYSIRNNLQEAVEEAYTLVNPGDVVLLSPACASYDQFLDFEDRGEKFKKFVEVLS